MGRRSRLRGKGEAYRPVVRVLKARRGGPTVPLIHGERYVPRPRGAYTGPRSGPAAAGKQPGYRGGIVIGVG